MGKNLDTHKIGLKYSEGKIKIESLIREGATLEPPIWD